MKCPDKLYKYSPFNVYTLRAICDAEAYYPSPETFNDPMDCKPSLKLDIDIREAERLLVKMMAARKVKKPRIRREILNHRYMATDDDGGEDDRTDEERHRRILERELLSELHLVMAAQGVFALSETYASSLMWSHYAEHHHGLCLEYDTTQNTVPELARVRYHELRVVRARDLNDWVFNTNKHAHRRVMTTFFYAKSDEWQYESEWRDLSGKAGVQSVPFKLTAVHFGTRTDSAVRQALIRTLSNDRDVELYDMVDFGKTFNLMRRPTERDYIEGTSIAEPFFIVAKRFDEVLKKTGAANKSKPRRKRGA